mmetsp:Transcript_31397/g.93946  ORF Transcript_31397/g.93946 Transcript_31397/m.93946 type:complete len:83 (-) Transcript_31397:75-323(-)
MHHEAGIEDGGVPHCPTVRGPREATKAGGGLQQLVEYMYTTKVRSDRAIVRLNVHLRDIKCYMYISEPTTAEIIPSRGGLLL